MPTASTPLNAASSTDIIAQAIHAQFSTRPTLRSETARLLKESLLEKYPHMDFDPHLTKIAQPIGEGAWRLTGLLDAVLQFLASGVPLDLADQEGRECFLSNKMPARLSVHKNTTRLPDMQVIAAAILELPDILYIGLQESLTEYWNDSNAAGTSRWQWLGDLLAGLLKTAAVRYDANSALQGEVLTELANNPDRQARLQQPWGKGVIQACTLQTTLTRGGVSYTLQTPDLLVIHGDTHLLCSVTGAIESYPSVDDFGVAWGERFRQHYAADTIRWKRFQPDGNIFDTQAALLLNQQLENLAALRFPARQNLTALQQGIDSITDVARLFSATPTTSPHLKPLQATLPDWLQAASAADRMAYRQHVLALASVKQQTHGRSFRDGIDDVHTFANKALHKQMLEDQPQAPGYNADELQLTFHVPVGDLGSGYLEPVNMSLTDLAINNLSSKPKGRMSIRHIGNQLIQDWTTEAYLLDLVSRVNVGKHYPEMINTRLLGDSAEAREHERLFSLELAIQLPLLALEYSIKAEQGFDRTGYRYVNALMQHTAAGRVVDEQAIVIRPLAFQRKANADCDVVANMFVIEPKNLDAGGPHILYRPLYTPALQQYASRGDLLKAIVRTGALQTSVLTWLSDRARPIYANNGFREPHILHVHLGDEFPSFAKPAPALLVDDAAAAAWLEAVAENRVLASLFVSNARALVELADQASVSNAESRWAIILEGGWLVFNVLTLPLQGPAMLAGWMLQIVHALVNDLPALDGDDPGARNLAWVDLLLNLGLVLLHVAKEHVPSLWPEGASKQAALTLEPLRRQTIFYPSALSSVVAEESPGLTSEPPGSGHTLLDFNLSTARDSASARLFNKLFDVRVAWPASLPDPVANGVFKGLYLIDNKWHATLGGLLFRVRIVPGFGDVYLVHPEHPDHPGIKLRSNGNGHWSLDQGLKLDGGGRQSRINAQREASQQRIALLEHNYQEYLARQERVQRGVDFAEQLMNQKRNLATASEKDRATFRQLYSKELAKQTDTYVNQIAEFKELAALKKSDPDPTRLAALLENSINNSRKRIVMADLDREATNRNYPDFSQGVDQLFAALAVEGLAVMDRYFEFMHETAATNETMIKLYEEVDARLLELKQIPRTGAEAWQRLSGGRPENELTSLRVKTYQLIVLRILSVKALGTAITNALEDTVTPLVLLSRSHAELHSERTYQRSDRIAVLDNLVEQYSKAQDGLESIGIFNADELQETAFNRLREIVAELRADAERRLGDELQGMPEPEETSLPSTGTSQQPNRPGAVRPGRKRVIKTSKGTLIGDLRPRVASQGGDIVDINGPFEDRPLVSFHEHQPDVWVEIIEPRPPAAAAAPRPYSQLIGAARKALSHVDTQVKKIEGYALRASSPLEIEEQLQREARKLTGYANGLEHHEQAPANRAQDVELISSLRAKAHALDLKATELRTRMILARPPTSEGVEFLLQSKAIYARVNVGRVQLKTGRRDFMQEYILNDDQHQPWWYAHFHYANADEPKANYTRAHLKTKEQRFETYESAMLKAKDAQQKIDIHHGMISEQLASNVFLPLEPR